MNEEANALSEGAKPSMDEVLRYALGNVRKQIYDIAGYIPDEQKEEIEQEAMVRVIALYPKLDPSKGWKSFVYTHAVGAVKDYQKLGHGFSETRKSLGSNIEELKLLLKAFKDAARDKCLNIKVDGEEFDFASLEDLDEEIAEFEKDINSSISRAPNLRDRVEVKDEKGRTMDVEQILGMNGVFSRDGELCREINWNLLARLASNDKELHALALNLKGFSLEAIAPVFGLSPQRVHGMIQSFTARFKVKLMFHDPRFKQVLYALGLCEYFDLPHVDQSLIHSTKIGWDLDPVDLDSCTPLPTKQISFEFDQ